MIIAYSSTDVWLSGFIGAVLGGGICGLVTGLFVQWQARETARHNLRAIAIRMGVHVKQCKGRGEGRRTEPWTIYMDEAVSAYHRYRALLWKNRRGDLDLAWKDFQGVDPAGDSLLAYRSMMDFDDCQNRVINLINFLSNEKPRIRQK